MKVLRIHAPGTDAEVASHVESAVRSFNASLDIRLRFLSIGIEEHVLAVDDAAGAAEQVGEALAAAAGGGPAFEAVLLLGGGEAAVAAVSTAVRARVPVVRVGAGARGGREADAARAVDRLSSLRLAHDDGALSVLRDEGLAEGAETVGAPDDPASGERIVRALSRARRRWPC